MYLSSLISKTKFICMPITYFILSLLSLYIFFQLLNRGLRMHIPIITGVQNAPTSLWNSHILLKPFFLRLCFRHKGRLNAKFLFDIFTIYPKCHLFHFVSRGTRMHIPILIGVQNEPERHIKDIVFCWKMFLLKLNFKDAGQFSLNFFFYILIM